MFVLSVNGQSVRFTRGDLTFVMSMKEWSDRFTHVDTEILRSYHFWKDGESVFPRPDIGFYLG